ncbi:MAG: miniconductance mechanosensitive channel [Candidatus Omnitrophota bacterium]|jgi:miniconductance mechanosensitive channel
MSVTNQTNEAAAVVHAFKDAETALNDGALNLSTRLMHGLSRQAWIPENWVAHSTTLIMLIGLILFGWMLYALIRPLLLRAVKGVIKRTSFAWDNELFGHGVFRWATHLVPALMVQAVAPGLFIEAPILAKTLLLCARVYLILTGYFLIDSILNAGHAMYRRSDLAQKMPIGTFLQVTKLLTALVAVILAIALVAGKSPFVLLGGLGVFASVIMLVFKDVILGFVAGIQLASNRMLAPGDWLEMPSHGADGDVEVIGLTTVKVRNFDRTVTTVPTYALITGSFKNWQGMAESDGRRIKRSLLIDVNSVRLCDEAMLKRFRGIEHIAEYLQEKEQDIAKWNTSHDVNCEQNPVNGRRLTNMGTFRAYIVAYLRNHPDINQDMTLLVRQLAYGPTGLPIEIYCFSANKAWVAYESIQADIFDHLFAVAREFELRIYQQPSGMDLRAFVHDGQQPD